MCDLEGLCNSKDCFLKAIVKFQRTNIIVIWQNVKRSLEQFFDCRLNFIVVTYSKPTHASIRDNLPDFKKTLKILKAWHSHFEILNPNRKIDWDCILLRSSAA